MYMKRATVLPGFWNLYFYFLGLGKVVVRVVDFTPKVLGYRKGTLYH